MSTGTENHIAMSPLTTAYKMFREAFKTDRTKLTRDERRAAIKCIDSLRDDLECELWADEMGIDVPHKDSDAWMAMYREYLRRNDSPAPPAAGSQSTEQLTRKD